MKEYMKKISNLFSPQRELQLNKKLAQAIQRDDIPEAETLLDQGADPNAILFAPRDRALHLAVDYASDAMIDLLLDRGADPSSSCHTYRCSKVTISRYAELAGRPEIAARLRERESGSHFDACGSQAPRIP